MAWIHSRRWGRALVLLVTAAMAGFGGTRAEAYGSPYNAATPWWLGVYIGQSTDLACAQDGLFPLTNHGNYVYYSSPEAVARDIATAYKGTISSITYTNQYLNANEQVIPSYVIDLTGSQCLMSFFGSSNPDEPLEAAVALYQPVEDLSDSPPYGTVCKDDSYVPRGQSCDDSKCPPDYCVPDDWDTKAVETITPGVEPLNVIISAKSDVPLAAIYKAMHDLKSGEWASGCLGAFRVSAEQADVAHQGYSDQEEAWRKGGCLGGNHLSLFGLENHVRIWHQDVPGSTLGAWFISASFETACVQLHGKLKPLRRKDGTYRTGRPWHCIDGGPGSYFTNGYDDGASNFVTQLKQAAKERGWHATVRTDSRPAGIGEDGVVYDGNVYVVTVKY